MLNRLIKSDSIFLGEGKAILIEEFGKDYGIYFSILSAIARGKTSRSEIENVVGKEIGGYLTKLENEYEVISKKQPIFEKSSTKNVRYTIEDNFFTFWFRFIYKYKTLLLYSVALLFAFWMSRLLRQPVAVILYTHLR